MILGRERFFDALIFARELARTIRGVLRVGVTPRSDAGPAEISPRATAWLITDTLAVICDYVLDKEITGYSQFFCDPSPENGETHPIAADPIVDLVPGVYGSRPSLLRLRQALPDRALRLQAKSLNEGDEVLVVHHPRGIQQTQVSMGRLIGKEGPWLRHDAATEGGSGGGPIISPTNGWGLSGMHFKASRQFDFNEGLSLSEILKVLRESQVWSEIARYHNLADVTAARKSLDQTSETPSATTNTSLLWTAVLWNFDPQKVREDDRESLKLLVNDSSAPKWTLRANERQALLRSAGSLEELRKLRGKDIRKELGQRVIDRILKGPPYELDKIDEAELPYWLQAVRWFADVAPELPTPAEVNRNLERRRIRSRLRAIAGPDFRGRAEQLGQLNDWYKQLDAGPMVVTGIGGVGKSSLVARFIELLPASPVLLWLDFDRADLAPDDAVSVLKLLSDQLSVQLSSTAHPFFNATTYPFHRPEAVALLEILAAVVRTPPAINILYERCGPDLPALFLGQPSRLIWTEALQNLTAHGFLRNLLDLVRTEFRNETVQQAVRNVIGPDDFTPSQISESSWHQTARTIGSALKRTPPPLLVLDGFEVAQQVKQHNEIWQVLKLILEAAPDLRIIVSGRAAVKDLDLDGRVAQGIHLTGMSPPDAKDWLREHGVSNEKVLESVVDMSDGVPLVLKLALRLIEEGGKIEELPQDLPRVMVNGFLYDRILDRVIDPLLKPVARDALVLRGLTEAMIPEVLSDRIPEGLDAHEVFSRLSLELGLVGDEGDPRALSVLQPGNSDVLRLRPEVRTATLKLLERDNASRVRVIDERAVAWYGKEENRSDPVRAAELVYHNLRLGNIKGAEQAWLNESALLLVYAEEDLPETAKAERAWLQARTSESSAPSTNIHGWEKEAAERIKAVLSRGLLRIVPDILKERQERSPASPLAIYDAWMRWQAGDLDGARERLGAVADVKTPFDRDRGVLGALFAASAGNRPEADRLLAGMTERDNWLDRASGGVEALAARAARIRLAVDLRKELLLSEFIRKSPSNSQLLAELNSILTPSDVILPQLCRQIGERWSFEDVSIPLPSSQQELESFRRRFQDEVTRTRARFGDPGWLPALDSEIRPVGPWRAKDVQSSLLKGRPPEFELAQDLAVLGWRRWGLATSCLFMAEAAELAARNDALSLAIAATLAAFHGYKLSFQRRDDYFPTLDHLLDAALLGRRVVTPHPLNADRISLGRDALASEGSPLPKDLEPTVEKEFVITGKVQGVGFRSFAVEAAKRYDVVGKANNLPTGEIQVVAQGPESKVDALKRELESGPRPASVQRVEERTISRDYYPCSELKEAGKSQRNEMKQAERSERSGKSQWVGMESIAVFLFGPDPLEMLARRVLGIPDSVAQ